MMRPSVDRERLRGAHTVATVRRAALIGVVPESRGLPAQAASVLPVKRL
jgi:hypothetical protein